MTAATFKASSPALKAVRAYCEKEARRHCYRSSYTIFIGERFNTENADIEPSINIACVSDLIDWQDTDLHCNATPWSRMREPLPLAENGAAQFDFWIYERGAPGEGHGDLICNAQAHFADGRLTYCEADGRNKQEYAAI